MTCGIDILLWPNSINFTFLIIRLLQISVCHYFSLSILLSCGIIKFIIIKGFFLFILYHSSYSYMGGSTTSRLEIFIQWNTAITRPRPRLKRGIWKVPYFYSICLSTSAITRTFAQSRQPCYSRVPLYSTQRRLEKNAYSLLWVKFLYSTPPRVDCATRQPWPE